MEMTSTVEDTVNLVYGRSSIQFGQIIMQSNKRAPPILAPSLSGGLTLILAHNNITDTET